MLMGKSRKGNKDKEWDELQKSKQEAKKLRAQVSKLRNVVKNIDTNHFNFVQDLLASEIFNQEGIETKKKLQHKLEQEWQCHTCGKGVMRLVILHRAGEPYYLRTCDHCDNKTTLKAYTEEIKGA
jgi:formylmethanofuran dehydrogenase subunit E